jgi:hypothetical protein
MDGLEEWRSDLRKIYSTDEVRGLEKFFDSVIFVLMIATISQLLNFYSGAGEIEHLGGS